MNIQNAQAGRHGRKAPNENRKIVMASDGDVGGTSVILKGLATEI